MTHHTATSPLQGEGPLLLGLGPRGKYVYAAGVLRRWPDGAVVLTLPDGGVGACRAADGSGVSWAGGLLVEDAVSLRWETAAGGFQVLDATPLPVWPDFGQHPRRALLEALWRELVVNLVDGVPLPNFLVYRKAWYRDAAMMALALQATAGLDLLRGWVAGLGEPYDRNNAGEEEPDNLGQVLLLCALTGQPEHPLIPRVLAEAGRRLQDGVLTGRTDFGEHPAYATLWLKYGMEALGRDAAHLRPPDTPDSYRALFWMIPPLPHEPASPAFDAVGRLRYPYLAWAADHCRGLPPPASLLALQPPYTWESHASQADYAGLAPWAPEDSAALISRPHTWHAAEALLGHLGRPGV